MKNVCTLAGAIALAALIATGARADDHRAQLVVASAAVSADQTTLFVTGANFGSSPAVALEGAALGGVTVNATGTALTAVMPSLPPGSYLLVVSRGHGRDDDGANAAASC